MIYCFECIFLYVCLCKIDYIFDLFQVAVDRAVRVPSFVGSFTTARTNVDVVRGTFFTEMDTVVKVILLFTRYTSSRAEVTKILKS